MTATKIWICGLCGFTYDEAVGLPEEGIKAGTAWQDIPDDFECPDCGFGKSDYEMVEVVDFVKKDNIGPVVIIGGGHAGRCFDRDWPYFGG